eukprot:jgi/Tetstr1/465076/TSEL_009804.t1
MLTAMMGLALVLAMHVVHVEVGWLPHSRREPQTKNMRVTITSRSSASGSARLSVRLVTSRTATAVDDGGGVDEPPPVPPEQPSSTDPAGRQRHTKWYKSMARNARRQENLEKHMNGSLPPIQPAFEFRRSGLPGGLSAPDPPGEPPIHLLGKVNLHLNQAQFDRDGTRGGIRPGRQRNGRFISASLTYPIIGPNGTAVQSHFSFNPADVYFVPPEQLNLQFSRCAVVGNSATLLRREYGLEIDGHDMVLRMNYAPVAGYERHVGSVTTFDMVNSKHASELSQRVVDAFHEGRPMLDESRNLTSLVLFEASNWRRNYYTYSRLLQKLRSPQLLILSPDFFNAAEVLWQRVSSRWPDLAQSCDRRVHSTELGFRTAGAGCREMGLCEDGEQHGAPSRACKPPSGFASVVFAAQLCNSITLYGFENVTAAAFNYTSHYFDDEPANLAAHSYVLTQTILHHLASIYPIDIRGA